MNQQEEDFGKSPFLAGIGAASRLRDLICQPPHLMISMSGSSAAIRRLQVWRHWEASQSEVGQTDLN